MLQDLRIALRVFTRQTGLAVTALMTLALGIGVNTAIFSIAYGVLFRPLPYADHAGIVRLYEVHPGASPPLKGAWLSNFAYHAWQASRGAVGEIETYSSTTSTMGDARPERLRTASVSPGLLEMLGIAPAAGRFFAESDALEGAPAVAVVSDGLWRERFGGGPFEPGRTLIVEDVEHEIVGLAPSSLGFPAGDVRLYTARAEPPRTGVAVFGAVARLATGASPDQAAAEGTRAARAGDRPRVVNMLFGEGGPVEVRAEPFAREMTSAVRPALFALAGGAACLLLIACANVANLLLSRGVSRERELAVRASLGARRVDLVRQLLAEGLVVSAAGGLTGVALAAALVRALPAMAPADFPRLDAVALDVRALGFAIAATVGAGLLSSIVPAVRGARRRLVPALRDGAGASAGGRTARIRGALLAGEAAMAVMLLIAAMLLGRSFVELTRVDGGFDVDRVVSARVYLPGSARGEADSEAFLRDVLERLRSRPGVAAAGAGSMAPFSPSTAVASFTMTPPGRGPVDARATVYVVTPGYAEALGLRLRAGRFLEERDRAGGLQAVVVNETFATTFLSGLEPVGLRFDSILARGGASEIVGVVGDVLKDGLERRPQPEAYVTTAHGYAIQREVNLIVRAAGDPVALVASLRQDVQSVEPRAAVDSVRTLAGAVSESLSRPRFAATVLGAFATLATLLAAVGLYGVLSYSVSRRRREIGIRAALGASRGRLLALVVGEGLGVAAIGLVAGVAGAAALTRLLGALLFGVRPLDPITFLAAPAVLLVVALAACLLPARRAAATSPVVALRGD